MTNFRITILIGLLAVAGCDLSSQQMKNAQQLAEALGVPVFVWASSDDVCAQAQFQSFLTEFTSASEADRAMAISEARRYSGIVFSGSQNLTALTGKSVKIQFA